MNQENSKIKYILYARKSSESEDRQVASIESQIKELIGIAKKEGLKIVDTLSESKSAKAPGRPLFNKMVEKINNGEAQGIICWKLDRLARNPIDGGMIQWMLQRGVISHIQTYERSYYSADNVLMMNVEFGMANQFIRDLSQNTKRGLRAKAEKGWFPGTAPMGYLNNKFKAKGEKDIVKDPKTFDLMRKLWDLLLAGNYTIYKLADIAIDKWRLKGKRSNEILNKNRLYEIFSNPFYCGRFKYGGEIYKGKHEPMVTEAEFEKAQVILGNRSKTHTTHKFAFTGLIRCGECGSMITAEEKIKRQKNGNVHFYTYYHCGKTMNKPCRQRVITKESLEEQIFEILKRIEIPPKFHQWIIKQMHLEREKESKDRNKILSHQQENYKSCVKKIDSLIEMRMENEITQEEFLKKKEALAKEKLHLQELLEDTDNRVNKWMSKAEALFNFAREARGKFENGTLEEKKTILINLGSNLSLRDGKLLILTEKPLILLEKAAEEVKAIHNRFEPLKTGQNEFNFEDFYAKSPLLGGRGDSNSP